MHCLRCHGLMVPIRLEDAGSSTLCIFGWQCLLCGEVIDSGIDANRKVSTYRRRTGGVLDTACRSCSGRSQLQGNEHVTRSLVQATPEYDPLPVGDGIRTPKHFIVGGLATPTRI